MSSADNDWSHPVWDELPVYDLTKEIVNKFLAEKFGNYEFFVTSVNADTLKFWIPRKLTEDERDQLKLRGNRVKN